MMLTKERYGTRVAPLVLMLAVTTACATVKVQAPDKPIEINLNVKIDQEVRVKLDREVEDLIAGNPDIF
ncbi:MAG: YnbE family lipoprotein [Amphiplicatus sp.]